jgi:hypothetical protein
MGIGMVVAAVLVVVGWRGRRIDNHPICRKCGFDLFGIIPDAESCPECGVPLTFSTIDRRGRRARSSRLVLVGVALLMTCMGLVAVSLSTVSIRPMLPTSLVLIELRYGGGSAEAAAEELIDRRQDKRLDDETLLGLVREFLDKQSDRESRWNPAWGDMIELAERDELLSDEQSARYAEQGVSIGVHVHTQMVSGNAPTIIVGNTNEPRFGTNGPLYSWSLAEIRVDDRTLPDDHGPICTLDHESDDSHRPGSIKDGFRNLGGTRSHHRGKRNVIPSLCLPPGKHNLSGTVLVEVGNRYIAREIEFDQTVDVLADHSALMMRVDDPELADQIRDSAVPTVRLVAMGRNTAELELEFEAWRIEPAIICGEIQVVVDGRLLDYTSFGSGDLVTRDFMPRSRGGQRNQEPPYADPSRRERGTGVGHDRDRATAGADHRSAQPGRDRIAAACLVAPDPLRGCAGRQRARSGPVRHAAADWLTIGTLSKWVSGLPSWRVSSYSAG